MSQVSFLIDVKRLKQLREERCLTQQELAARVYGLLGKAAYSTPGAQLTHYQRIEKEGRTSRKTADALAKALGVSLRLLQGLEGPDPAEFFQSIKGLLHRQAVAGGNDRLQLELAHHEGNLDERVECLAEVICARVEAVQLSHNPELLADLLAITGQPIAELMAPASMHGHWCVNTIQFGEHRAEIIHGAFSACFRIQEIIEHFLESAPSDASLELSLDGFWFRLVARDARRRRVLRVDFARCIADDEGLRWTSASWRDDLWLKQPLIEWMAQTANFVSLFGEPTVPANPDALRLWVTKLEEYRPVGELIFGDLNEIPENIKAGHRQAGSTHLLSVDALFSQLFDVLPHYMEQAAARQWQVSRTWAGIEFRSTPTNLRTTPSVGYRVQLVEQLASGEIRPVPWRHSDIRRVEERCKAWLAELSDWVRDQSLPIPPFKPLPQHDPASQS